jgi:nucleotide-binding universal stress UspA family protein
MIAVHPATTKDRAMYHHLLVPVDGSELSERAIEASIELAQQLGAAITGFVAEPVLPVVAMPKARSVLAAESQSHHQSTEAHARGVLARFEASAQRAGVKFSGFYDRVPQVDRAIIEAAESQGCDMIVMVTHGRGAFGEFLFGSQTKAVLAGSKLPLLVLH